MISIGAQLQMFDTTQKSRITNERQDIIRQFLEALNLERIGSKYKPLTGRAVAMKVSHLKDNGTLYHFLSCCKDYKSRNGSFSKYFFGALKVR